MYIDTEASWWQYNLATKLGGRWYSTTAGAWCGSDATGPPDKPCSWRTSSVVKQISKECHDQSIVDFIVAQASPTQHACFASCPSYNMPATYKSDPCWARCFFALVLGPRNGHLAEAECVDVAVRDFDELKAFVRASSAELF